MFSLNLLVREYILVVCSLFPATPPPPLPPKWMEMSEALLRIAGRISRAKRDEWKKSIENLSCDPKRQLGIISV